MNAVIDRITGRIDVLLLGDKETEVQIPVKDFSKEAREGTWLSINFKIYQKATTGQYRKNLELLKKI